MYCPHISATQSNPRAGHTFSAPGRRDSRYSAHECGKVLQPYAPAAFPPQEIFLVLISARDGVEPRATVRPEGLGQWNIPMIPSGIEPSNFRLAAQCLNQPLRQTAEYTWKSRSQDRTSNAEPSKCAALMSHKFYTTTIEGWHNYEHNNNTEKGKLSPPLRKILLYRATSAPFCQHF